MAKYQFLSEEWIEAAKKIREEHADAESLAPSALRMNQIITEVPFGEGTINAHVDTANGAVEMDLGHIENPELTVTVEYSVAKALIVDGDQQAGMQAFMSGKITVDGDIMKLMSMQTALADPKAAAVAEAIKAITE